MLGRLLIALGLCIAAGTAIAMASGGLMDAQAPGPGATHMPNQVETTDDRADATDLRQLPHPEPAAEPEPQSETLNAVPVLPTERGPRLRAFSPPPMRAPVDDVLRRAAGQLVLAGFFGRSVRDRNVQALRDEIRAGRIGGVILMDRNITNARQTRTLISALQDAAPPGSPLLIGVDQEGGAVQRIDAPGRRRRFLSAWRLARAGDIARMRATYQTLSRQLADLGFNLNFGPVVDLRLNPRNPIIARMNRSFGDDPAMVADYARVFIDAHHGEGLATTLKHFPGHGSSWGDTHDGFVNITRPFRDIELAPYAKLMATGHADAIMMGHLAHAAFGTKSATDDRPMPASLSPVAIQKVLREELGFQRVVITDDLAMGAIKRYFDFETTVRKALLAGNDVLLMTSGPRGMRNVGGAMHSAIVKAVAEGVIGRGEILQRAARVRALKTRIREWDRLAGERRARERARQVAEAARKAAEREAREAATPLPVPSSALSGLKGSVE
jgi:beta-N-acetylhexosaminidase